VRFSNFIYLQPNASPLDVAKGNKKRRYPKSLNRVGKNNTHKLTVREGADVKQKNHETKNQISANGARRRDNPVFAQQLQQG
jgi:hypothetical protein